MRGDIVVGVVALLFAAAYYYAAHEIPRSLLADEVGAAGLPEAYAIALALLSAWVLVKALVSPGAPSEVAEPPALRSNATHPWRHVRALGLLAPGIAYLLLVSILGYALVIFLLLLSIALYAGAKFDIKVVLISAGGAACLWFVFVKLFSIPLPTGTLWQALTG